MHALTHPILTPRLKLEPVTAALAQAARAGQGAFAELIGAEAPLDWCAASLPLVARSAAHAWGADPAPTRAVAIHRAEGAIIGDVRFEPSMRAQGRPVGEVEIGYSVAQSRRRQGYAVEATGALIDWLLAEAGAESIIAGCDSRNLASVRTLRRLGFWLDSTPGRTFWWTLTQDQLSSRA